MAMIAGTGFEMGSVSFWTPLGTPEVSTAYKRTGTYSCYANHTEGMRYSHGSPLAEVYMGVGVRPLGGGSDTYGNTILGARNVDANIVFGVGFEKNNNVLTAMLTEAGSYSYSAVGYGPALTLGTWYYVEVYAKIANDPDGVLQVRLDGVEVINYTGDTLRITNGSQLSQFGFGKVNDSSLNPMQIGVAGYYDDFKVNDTTGDENNSWPGRGGFVWVPATGAGTTTQFTPSAGANWECVDEVPADDDTSYVSTDTADLIDTYAVTVPGGVSGGVAAAIWWEKAKTVEAGGGNISPVLRIGGANYVGAEKGLDTSYQYVSQVYNTNPATDAAWTLTDIGNLEVGQKSIG